MRLHTLPHLSRQRGTTLIEVLVTIVLLAFGLLGIAALQAKAQVGTVESYQRAQAVVLLQDMRARLSSNQDNADDYLTTTPLGTKDSEPEDCSTLAAGAERDKCEWSNALKGAAEQDGTTRVGAMIGARGCIERLQVKDESSGVCRPGVYRLTVAWQGMHPTLPPSLACGKGEYGQDDGARRAISVRVSIGLPHCT
jgi:type IV pilus assembly protein PilV